MFDGGHVTTSLCATRGQEVGATRGATQQPAGARRREGGAVRGRQEGGVMIGNATTSRCNETMRGRRSESERMTRGDATSSRHGEKTRDKREA